MTATPQPGAEQLRETINNSLSLARELKPDLIFMDVVMPGLNGFQATRNLSRDPVTKSIPVVMVTTILWPA